MKSETRSKQAIGTYALQVFWAALAAMLGPRWESLTLGLPMRGPSEVYESISDGKMTQSAAWMTTGDEETQLWTLSVYALGEPCQYGTAEVHQVEACLFNFGQDDSKVIARAKNLDCMYALAREVYGIIDSGLDREQYHCENSEMLNAAWPNDSEPLSVSKSSDFETDESG